jgi:hypothetical protein
MSEKHLKLEPHNINEHAWWYEEKNHISVVFHRENQGSQIVEIPWRSIRAALKRLDKKERKVGLWTRMS